MISVLHFWRAIMQGSGLLHLGTDFHTGLRVLFVYSVFFSRNCHLISERWSFFQYEELLNFPDSLVKTKKQPKWQTNCMSNWKVTVVFWTLIQTISKPKNPDQAVDQMLIPSCGPLSFNSKRTLFSSRNLHCKPVIGTGACDITWVWVLLLFKKVFSILWLHLWPWTSEG